MRGINFDGYMAEINKRTLYYTGVDVNEKDVYKRQIQFSITKRQSQATVLTDLRI